MQYSRRSQSDIDKSGPSCLPLCCIGGIGGSGTRLVADLLARAGVYIGFDLNRPLDNLTFTLLFKHAGLSKIENHDFGERFRLFSAAMSGSTTDIDVKELVMSARLLEGREQHSSEWLVDRYHRLKDVLMQNESFSRMWAWKEPNTHIVLGRIVHQVPQMRYIHVLRHGLDMAFSQNQHQPRLWSKELFGDEFNGRPSESLRYWVKANERAAFICREQSIAVEFVRFEEMCEAPDEVAFRLLDFLGLKADHTMVQCWMESISPNSGAIGRYREHDLSQFGTTHIDALGEWGYSV